MTNAFYINGDHEFVLVRPTGKFTEENFIGLCHAIFDHPERHPRYAHIWDTRSIESLAMGADVIELYKDFLEDSQGHVTTGDLAVVATRKMVSTFARMLAEIRKNISEGSISHFENLEDTGEAMDIPAPALTDIPEGAWVEAGGH